LVIILSSMMTIYIASTKAERASATNPLYSLCYGSPLTNTFDELLRLIEKSGAAE
jgi:hypothetical protein